MSRRIQGRLRPLTRGERHKKIERNFRRRRPRFGFDSNGKRYSKPTSYININSGGYVGKILSKNDSSEPFNIDKIKATAPNRKTVILEKKDF